jgi:REP element-mobilizing transposase RayT
MPARPRDDAPGAHHVWVKATGNWPYFIDELDRERWIRLLEQVAARLGWKVLAFCEMRTHAHALLDIPDLSLP